MRTVLKPFIELPYGAKFRYQGSQEVWVRTQHNVIAAWNGLLANPTFQSLCCFCHIEGDEDGNTLQTLVEVVEYLPAEQPQGEPVACNHEWTDDGEFMLVCTVCGAQENHDPKWRDIGTAPRDGTLVRLLVDFTEHATEDSEAMPSPTIGANSFDHTGEDLWQFAGWSWEQDCFTQGAGEPVGWLPLLDTPHADPAEVESKLSEQRAEFAKASQIEHAKWSTEVERISRKAANADLALAAQTKQVHNLREGLDNANINIANWAKANQKLKAQLTEAHALLRDTKAMLASELSYELFAKMANHIKRIDAALSASAYPINELCADGAHELVPFRSDCVRCGEPYSAEPSAPVERDERAEFERKFVVQEGVFFSGERNEYRSMNGRAIEETDATDLNLRLSGWQARAALERKQ